jgi:HAD superfamily hydrolase (TIGR01509 family)
MGHVESGAVSRPAAVIFDCDGLLLDTEDAWTRAEKTLFAEHGGTFTLAHKRDMIGSSHLVAAGKIERILGLPGRGEELMTRLHGLVAQEARAGVEPRPGAVELVHALVAAGMPIAVASNSRRAFLDQVLESSGMAPHFPVSVAGDEVARAKPAPDIYVEACRRLGVDPGASVGLEDSPIGAAAVRAAGMFVVAVPFGPDMPVPDADLWATSLADDPVRVACGLAPATEG